MNKSETREKVKQNFPSLLINKSLSHSFFFENTSYFELRKTRKFVDNEGGEDGI